MNDIPITQLYDLLALKLGRGIAGQLTVYIEDKIKDEFMNKSQLLATKEDVSKLDVKISETKSELIKWMFLFWIAQAASTFGFILIYLKK